MVERFSEDYGVKVIVLPERPSTLAIVTGAAVFLYILAHTFPGIPWSHLLKDGVGVKMSASGVIVEGSEVFFEVIMRYDLSALMIKGVII